jgi:LacI family transcriptional regulator
MQKVMASGYRQIGFVMHRGWDHAVDHLWTAGFLCEQQHLSTRERVPSHIFPEPQPVERWFNENNEPVVADLPSFSKWFNRYKPEVLISKGSFVLPLLAKMGVRIPRDLAFVDVFLDKTDGVTAGVRQNHATVGGAAVEILAGQLQHNKFGVPEIPTTTFVEGTWFDGLSCPPRLTPAKPAARASKAAG